MNDEKTLEKVEINGAVEMVKILSQTLSDYRLNDELLSISKSLTEISKNIKSSYISDMCFQIVKKYSDKIKTIEVNSLSNIKLDTIVAIQKIMQRTIESIKESCNYDFHIDLKSNLFTELSQATSYIIRDKRDNADELVELALPAKINAKALEMISLFEKIQELDMDLVKLTPVSCGAIAVLVGQIATNELNFAAICNSAYQLFYEGFGGFKHRSCKYIDFDDHKALITIKHLRLKYFHDIYHGDAKSIVEKNENISNAFIRLINKRTPIVSKDYRMCQLKLYELIIDWLKQIINKINSPTILVDVV